MADNKAVNQTAAKPEEAKADKKAKAKRRQKEGSLHCQGQELFWAVSPSISVIPKAS